MLDLVQALKNKPGKNKSKGKSKPVVKSTKELDVLAMRFRNADNVKLLAGARRALTCYARKRAKEIGSTEVRCVAGAKMYLTKQGVAY